MPSFVFNGINGLTGEYLLPEMTAAAIARVARHEGLDPENLKELKHRTQYADSAHLGVKEGIDPKNLAQAGWGVLFAADDGGEAEARLQALKPLLDLRKEQAGELYREYVGPAAYRPGESKDRFLARHGTGPGPADPDKVPYYLLLVASPEFIPYRFQYQLDVQYAVGRIHFDTLEEYAHYAESVVRAEQGETLRSRTATFFGVQNDGDRATNLSAQELVVPLSALIAEDQPEWSVNVRVKDETKKADLAAIFEGADSPALLFTASHGMGFPNGHALQLPHQGALLCQDWHGPGHRPNADDHFFSGEDLGSDACVGGLVTFHFACYGAGTPLLDDFAHQDGMRVNIAPQPFVALLPRRLLGHPRGGALAAVGHVERAWTYSFLWPGASAQLAVFESTLKRLLEGHPVGSAMEFFGQRYAEVSATLSDELEEIKFGAQVNETDLAAMWTANNDARSYSIVGDPAVRLAVF